MALRFRRVATTGGGPHLPAASSALPARHAGLPALPARNLLCTVLFLDLVSYSTLAVDDQVATKCLLNELVLDSLDQRVPQHSRLVIDTGDGAAICSVGDPLEALKAALQLRQHLQRPRQPMMHARLGLHLGWVRVVTDINERMNVLGDGINVGKRIADFAQPDQVLVSGTFRDVMASVMRGRASDFRNVGPFRDKHGRMHEVYEVQGEEVPLPEMQHGLARTLPEAAVRELAAELDTCIGPLATALVRHARGWAASMTELRQAVAPAIADEQQRQAFLAARQH
jgi:class 3 adenylate cyclase